MLQKIFYLHKNRSYLPKLKSLKQFMHPIKLYIFSDFIKLIIFNTKQIKKSSIIHLIIYTFRGILIAKEICFQTKASCTHTFFKILSLAHILKYFRN